MSKDKLLLVENNVDSEWANTLVNVLNKTLDITTAHEKDCLSELKKSKFSVVMIDAVYAKNSTLLITKVRNKFPNMMIIISSAAPTIDSARIAFHAGANDYIQQTINKSIIKEQFSRLIQ